MLMGDVGNRLDVAQFQQGIGGGFQPYQAGIVADAVGHQLRLAGIDVAHLDFKAFVKHPGKQPSGAAVEIVKGHDMLAGFEQR